MTGKSKQEKAIEQIGGDIVNDLREAIPQLIDAVEAGRSQGTLAVTVTLKKHKGSKTKSAWTEIVVDSKTNAPGAPRHYAVDIDDGQMELLGTAVGDE